MLAINNFKVCGRLLLLLLISGCLLGADEATLTDPTRPPNAVFNPKANAIRGGMILTAIFIYPRYRVAIIDGKATTVGAQIGEYTITTITANTVELTGSDNTKQILQLVTPIKVAK